MRAAEYECVCHVHIVLKNNLETHFIWNNSHLAFVRTLRTKEWSQCTEWSAHDGICFISDWMLFNCQFRAFRSHYTIAYIAYAQMTFIFSVCYTGFRFHCHCSGKGILEMAMWNRKSTEQSFKSTIAIIKWTFWLELMDIITRSRFSSFQ